MGYQQSKVLTTKRSEFSRQSIFFGALFIVTLAVAICVDLDAVLEYFKILGGPAGSTLELGAIISAGTAIPFLATGMSIAEDLNRNKTARE
jgi:hypothetical protein